jgi:hypothetical protein
LVGGAGILLLNYDPESIRLLPAKDYS